MMEIFAPFSELSPASLIVQSSRCSPTEGKSQALLICANQARLEDCWDDSSTRPALSMTWNRLEEGWTKGWEAAGNFLVI